MYKLINSNYLLIVIKLINYLKKNKLIFLKFNEIMNDLIMFLLQLWIYI